MFEAFRLKGAVGGDMSVDLDDTLGTKKALRTLGHFQTPSYGLTEYPDQAMIDGLKSFQRANDLRVDGVMHPDGPTHRKLTLALTQPRSEPAAPSNQATYERSLAPAHRRRPLTLKQPVKASASVDLDDVLKIKTALAVLGLLREPKDGLSLYPDRAMFDAVEAFQRRAGLRVDGEMAPDGPTVRKINAATELDASPDEAHQESGTEREGRDETAVAPVIPLIVYEIAVVFGMTIAAAYAWWSSMSEQQKSHIRAQLRHARGEEADETPSEEDCERLLEIDTDTCNGISRHRGKAAAARCFASAMERYSACRLGKPKDQWPPLNTWNN
jgi:peptidoglycan hydrolase-like protein with peptidoglycan-binding domain